MSANLFDIITVVDGTADIVSQTTGSGNPRLYEGDTALYIYSLTSSLQRSTDGGFTFDEIRPPDIPVVRSITQTTDGSLNVTVIFSSGSTSANVGRGKYHVTPETTGGWASTGNLSAGFFPIDAVSYISGNPVLPGNSLISSTVKAMRNTSGIPYTPFTESDAGLPQSGVASGLTDLEMAGY